MNRTIARLLLLLLCVLSVGCERRELCYDHSHGITVNITFDWRLAPDAAPSTMVVWAFPTDGSQGIRHEFTSRLRGNCTLKLPPGSYRLVCFNGNTEENIERGSRFDDFRLTTDGQYLLAPLSRQDDAPRPGNTEGQPVRSPAAHLYAHTHPETLVLLPEDAGRDRARTVTFTPRRVSSVWNVRIEEIRNYVPGIEASAIVTGVSEAWSPKHGRPCGTEVTVPFPMTFGTGDAGTTLTGQVVLFGDAAPHDVRHKLRVYTSRMYYYDFDVTDRVHSAPDPYNVHITLRGMTLPSGGGGMSPGVDGWEDTENIEIPM